MIVCLKKETMTEANQFFDCVAMAINFIFVEINRNFRGIIVEYVASDKKGPSYRVLVNCRSGLNVGDVILGGSRLIFFRLVSE